MDERFADLPGWPGYRVSSLGRLYGRRGRQLAGYRDKDGYHCVAVGPRGRSTAIKVHRAVAAAFVGPIPEGMQVNHKNGVKDDNRVENLEIVTPAENTRHGFAALGRIGKNTNPTKGTAHHNSSLTEDSVREIRRLYAAGCTQVELAQKFQTAQTNISRIVRRTAWAHVL
jgi:hypothetical protein